MYNLKYTYLYTSLAQKQIKPFEEFNLINMPVLLPAGSGRVYDPLLARFLNADPFIQDNTDAQNYNRYSYVLNNPTKYTDPSGYVYTNYDLQRRIQEESQQNFSHEIQMSVEELFRIGEERVKSEAFERGGPSEGGGVNEYVEGASTGENDPVDPPYGWPTSISDVKSVRTSGLSQVTRGATVYVEHDGIGHVYIQVNGFVFSYGRYDGSYSPYLGAFGPVGNGVLLKKDVSFVKERMSKYPTSVYNFPNADANKIYNYLINFYKSGTPTKNKGRVVDTYYLIGNNCTSFTTSALQFGGVNIPTLQTPSGFNAYMNSLDWYKYVEFGPKY